MILYLSNIIRIAWAEIRTRDRGMILGSVWTLVNPILLFITLFAVFATSTGKDGYPAYLLAGLLIWTFFSGLVTSVSQSNIYRSHFLKATVIPYTAPITGSVLASFFFFVIEVIVCSLLLGCFFHQSSYQFGVHVIMAGILATPFFFIIGMLILWTSIFIPDYSRVWNLTVRLGFFLTPVFYKLESVALGKWLECNPIVYYLHIARNEDGASVSMQYIILLVHLCACAAILYLTERKRSSFAEFGL